jgi:hypothetical protein
MEAPITTGGTLSGWPRTKARSPEMQTTPVFGRSVGKWEGDALVVDIKDFNERFWFSNGGFRTRYII